MKGIFTVIEKFSGDIFTALNRTDIRELEPMNPLMTN
jgi:hypothetical protein